MDSRHALADVAALIGVPARAAMLLSLLDGRALPSGVLAQHAGLSAAAASLHLGKLVQGGLLAVEPRGRTRLYRLAHRRVAHALEALGALSTRGALPGLSAAQRRLREARRCYDHLAGRLSIALVTRWTQQRLLSARAGRFHLSDAGRRWFAEELAIEVAPLQAQRRGFAPCCLDWTERVDHLAGSLGAAVLEAMLARRWLAPGQQPRALRLTVAGARACSRWGVELRSAG